MISAISVPLFKHLLTHVTHKLTSYESVVIKNNAVRMEITRSLCHIGVNI